MPLPANFQELLHNKPAMIGLAAAGGVGLFVFLRRHKSDGTDAGSSAGSTGASIAGGVPTYDTTATDLAGFLSSWNEGLSNQLTDWLKQAGTQLNPPPESVPSPVGPKGPTLPDIRPLDNGGVLAGRNVQGYFEAWNRHDPTLNLTWRKFLALNPGVDVTKNINTHGNTNGADDTFIGNYTYRIR